MSDSPELRLGLEQTSSNTLQTLFQYSPDTYGTTSISLSILSQRGISPIALRSYKGNQLWGRLVPHTHEGASHTDEGASHTDEGATHTNEGATALRRD